MAGKKKIILALMLLVLGLSTIIVYLLTNFLSTSTITQNFTEPTDNRATIGVRGSEGEVLTFKLTSKITEGDVQFIITDSEKNVIGSFGQDIVEQKIVFEKDDIYEIAALSESLTGKFKLKVYQK